MTFEQAVLYLVSGGAGPLVYWWLEKQAWFQKIEEPDYKRWTAFGITACFGLIAWVIGVVFEIIQAPAGDWRAWVAALVSVALAILPSFATSQLAHTKAMKRARVEANV
jgi:hypothetical protein